MTLEEFLEHLKKTSGWYAFKPGAIRRSTEYGTQCPITAVHEQVTGRRLATSEWTEAAINLGLPFMLASDIVSAADCFPGSEELRKRLLGATVHA